MKSGKLWESLQLLISSVIQYFRYISLFQLNIYTFLSYEDLQSFMKQVVNQVGYRNNFKYWDR